LSVGDDRLKGKKKLWVKAEGKESQRKGEEKRRKRVEKRRELLKKGDPFRYKHNKRKEGLFRMNDKQERG
jgi:hypothetical protein